jgi:hypothetical protein
MLKYNRPMTDHEAIRLLRMCGAMTRMEARRLKNLVHQPESEPIPEALLPALEKLLFVQVLPPTESLH